VKIPYELKIFSVIMLSTLLIFSFSHFGVQAFEGLVSKGKGFQENTWIGPIDISGLEKTEANQLLATKVTEWQANSSIQLSFMEVNGSLPLENIIFRIEESVQNAKDSTRNEVIINIDDSTLHHAITSMAPTLSENKVDIDLLKRDIITKVSTLQMGTIEISLGDFLNIPIEENQIVHRITIPITNEDLQNIGATLMIEPKGTFSVLSFLEKQGLSELDPTNIDLLSSGIYQSILSTNFEILERHIGVQLPENISLGYEAKVDSKLKWDLSFYNPNEEIYKIEMYSDGTFLVFEVVGVPFLYEYKIMQEDLQVYDPKIIKQFSPLLEPGQLITKKAGQKGYYVEVFRLILNETGKIMKKQLLAKDFYSPVHQVEVSGLDTVDPILSEEQIIEEIIPGEVVVPGEVSDDQLSPEEPNVSNKDFDLEPTFGSMDDDINK
jgi:hypothetical protein